MIDHEGAKHRELTKKICALFKEYRGKIDPKFVSRLVGSEIQPLNLKCCGGSKDTNQWPSWAQKCFREMASFVFDHYSYDPKEGILYSEPYNLHGNDLLILAQYCEANGLEFYVRGRSVWYPPATFVVAIMKARENTRWKKWEDIKRERGTFFAFSDEFEDRIPF